MPIATINPATGETIETFTPLTDAQVEDKLRLAAEAFREHRQHVVRRPGAEDAPGRRHPGRPSATLAATMTLEVGKTLRSVPRGGEKCARGCRFYADHAEAFLADRPIEMDGAQAYTHYRPLGPVLAIMPWNFPLWQVFRFAAPALMAGNVGLLKHAENVPRCALAIEDVFRRAGFPEGVFQTLLIELPQVPAVLDDPRVAAVTLTGSDIAGRRSPSRPGAT